MASYEEAIEDLRRDLALIDARLVVLKPGASELEPPLFVNVGVPPRTEEELERLLKQDGN